MLRIARDACLHIRDLSEILFRVSSKVCKRCYRLPYRPPRHCLAKPSSTNQHPQRPRGCRLGIQRDNTTTIAKQSASHTENTSQSTLLVRLFLNNDNGSLLFLRRISKHPHHLHPSPILFRPLRLRRRILLPRKQTPNPDTTVPRSMRTRTVRRCNRQHQ